MPSIAGVGRVDHADQSRMKEQRSSDGPLLRKLSLAARFTPEETALLEELARERTRRVAPREDIAHEGERRRALFLVVEGWAARYKALEDGRRQILGFALPGDMCEQHAFAVSRCDHGLSAITAVTVAEIGQSRLADIVQASPRIARALAWCDVAAASIQREWIVNLGQRTAFERMAHLICELFTRLGAIGHTQGSTCELPVTQAMLADAMGISAVHVNRTIQELRAAGLITLRGKSLTIHDLTALQQAALFTPGYLHLDEGMAAQPSMEATSEVRGSIHR